MVKGEKIIEVSGQVVTGIQDVWADVIVPFVKKNWKPIIVFAGLIVFILIMIFG